MVQVRVDVGNGSLYDIEGNLAETIENLQAHLSEVPEHYRPAAKIDFSIDETFGSSYDIYYYREETPAETTVRIARQDLAVRNQEANERAILNALLKKYGKPE